MKRNEYRTVVEDLRAARAGLYRELASGVGQPRERELVGKVSDLLLAEEILLEQAGEKDGEEPDAPAPHTAEAADDTPDFSAWEQAGEWEYLGEFRRLPRGGVLVDYRSGKETFVPEGVVRNEAIEHGDIVGAVAKGESERHNPLYYFEVLDRRGRGEESDRLFFIAPLELRGGEWGAWCEDEGIFVTVPDGDVSSLKLSEGDLVEIGYHSGEPVSAKVAWRFDPGDAFVRLRTLRKEPRRTREREENGGEARVLEDTTVLVVGADAYKETFKRVFERRGARFTWESGFMVGKFLESKVRRADIVVIVTEAMKHKMPDVEAVCDRNGKPYVYAPSRGASGALREVLKLLDLDEDTND